MRILFSERSPHYTKYAFPYQVWLWKEPGDDEVEILKQGFVPARLKINLFYLARSLRVDLTKFVLNSENRRILKKTEGFDVRIISQASFVYNRAAEKICLSYAGERWGAKRSNQAGLRRIFSRYLSQKIFVWSNPKGRVLGYAPILERPSCAYYWGAFTDPSDFVSGLGVRMMLEVLRWAQKDHKKYVYLGTGYTTGALYKTNFFGWEFFNGLFWSRNLKELKYLVQKQSKDELGMELLKDRTYLAKFQGSPKGLPQFLSHRASQLKRVSFIDKDA